VADDLRLLVAGAMAGYFCHCGRVTWNGQPGYCCIDHQNERPDWGAPGGGGHIPGNNNNHCLPATVASPFHGQVYFEGGSHQHTLHMPSPRGDGVGYEPVPYLQTRFSCWCRNPTWDEKPGYCSIDHSNEFPQWGPAGQEWYRTYLNSDGTAMVENRKPCLNKCGRAANTLEGYDTCCMNCRLGQHCQHTERCQNEWLEVRRVGGYCRLAYQPPPLARL